MVKKMLRALCVLLIMLLPVCAAAEGRVFDEANLFSGAEISEMEQWIEQIQSQYQVDVVVLTSYDAPYNRSLDYADLYYENGGFGVGEDDAGLLFFIDMNNRVPTISTTGVMIDYITDSRLEALLDTGYDELADGEYGEAALDVLQLLDTYMRRGREEGSFRYDAETGKRLSGLYNKLTGLEILIAVAVAAIVTVVFVSSVSSGYSLKGGQYNYDARGTASVELTRRDEQFIHETVNRRPRPQASSSSSGGSSGRGSAVHRSSSGHSHGGGSGRRF